MSTVVTIPPDANLTQSILVLRGVRCGTLVQNDCVQQLEGK